METAQSTSRSMTGLKEIFAQYLDSTKNAIVYGANRLLDISIFLMVLANESLRFIMKSLDFRLVELGLELGLQLIFFCILSLIIFNLTLLVCFAGFVRTHIFMPGSFRHRSLQYLLPVCFDFIHQAFFWIEFWMSQTDDYTCGSSIRSSFNGDNGSTDIQTSGGSSRTPTMVEKYLREGQLHTSYDNSSDYPTMVEKYLKERQVHTKQLDNSSEKHAEDQMPIREHSNQARTEEDDCSNIQDDIKLSPRKERLSPSNSFISMR